jgi:hypothetical protein
MEFYLAGVLGMGVGFALQAFVSAGRQPRPRGLRWRRLEFAVIVLAVSFWIFSPLVFPAAVDLLAVRGVGAPAALTGAWFGCMALVVASGFALGCLLGADKTPRRSLPNPFTDGSPDPFGAAGAEPHAEVFHFPDEGRDH